MADISESPIFTAGIYQTEITDPVLAGPNAGINVPIAALANRTAWLKAQMDAFGVSGDAVEYSGNLNDLTSNGFYLIRNASTNKPISDDGMAIVVKISSNPDGSNTPATLQIFVDNGIGTFFWRVMANGIVLPWAQAHTKNLFDAFTATLVGQVSAFAMEANPTGWLKCNGAAVSRTTYSALFAKIGTVYGSGNGTTTFNLPDLRGYFVRGYDDGRGVDASRVFGSAQDDELAEHSHSEHTNEFVTQVVQSGTGSNTSRKTNTLIQDSGNTGGDETRPKNIALNYFIRY